MPSVVLLVVLWAALSALLMLSFIVVELISSGRSGIVRSIRNTRDLVVRLAVLRPIRLIPPRRTTTTFVAVTMLLVFLGALVGWSWQSVHPGSVPAIAVLRTLLLPLLVATAVLAMMGMALQARAVAAPLEFGRQLARLSALVVLAGATAASVSTTPVLSVTLGVVYANLMYGFGYVRKSGVKYRARVANDRDFMRIDDEGYLIRILWRIAQQGFVPVSFLIIKYVVPEPETKDEFKVRAVLAYHMHRYAESRSLSAKGIRRMEEAGDASQILVSYHALATARIDSIEAGTAELQSALVRNPANYYYRSNLSYLLWSSDRLAEATVEASRAIAEYNAHCGSPCAQTATYLGLFFAEQALESRLQTGRVDLGLVRRSLALSQAAHVASYSPSAALFGEGPGSITHNLALATMLLSDTVETVEAREDLLSFAFHAFARSVWRESHAASRFRLAVLHMVGSSRYESAELQLNRILWALRNQPKRLETRFAKLVRLNLDRIREARARKIVFNREIIFLSSSPELVPRGAIQPASETTDWLSLDTRRVFRNPFRYMPIQVKEAIAESGPEPWLA